MGQKAGPSLARCRLEIAISRAQSPAKQFPNANLSTINSTRERQAQLLDPPLDRMRGAAVAIHKDSLE